VLLFPLGYMVRRVRRLFAAGYEREDLVEALEAALERRREELAFLYGEGPSGFERTLRRLSYAALGAAAAAVGLHLLEPAPLPDASLFAAFGVSALAALLAAIVARARTEHRTDPKAERRLRFWRGPLGRWLCRVAGLRLHRDPAAAQQPVPTSALRPAEEARAGDGCDARFAGEPARERVVRQVGERGEVRQDIVGALGGRAAEPGRGERAAQEIPPGAVVSGEAAVVLRPQRLEPDRHGLLQRRRCTDREEV